MKQFLSLLDGMMEYEQLKTALQNGRTPISVSGAAASHKTNMIAALVSQLNRRALIIVPDESTAIRFAADLSTLLGEKVLHFPARDYVLLDVDGASGEFEHQRLGVLSAVLRKEAKVVVSSIESACERTIPVKKLEESILTIDSDGQYDCEKIVEKLVAMGYQRRDQVEGICQFARRGGILDIFPPDRTDPVRIEFWDDEIDMMSSFQVDTQRRQDPVDKVTIPPAREVLFDSPQALIDLLNKQVEAQKGKTGLKVKEHLERDIERLCMRLLLLQQPVATDLRVVSSALKMISDLERIGDQAANIAEISLLFSRQGEVKVPQDIGVMACKAGLMVRQAISSYTGRDVETAHAVGNLDDEVDELVRKIKGDLINQVADNLDEADLSIDFIIIAKYLERIADHAVNIAQWAIFCVTGEL